MNDTLTDRLPAGAGPDDLLDVFVGWSADRGLDLYPAQEEAILELLAGNHVIPVSYTHLTLPTILLV